MEEVKMTKEDVVKQFTSLKGIGKAKAELLYNNGLDSLDKLKKASIEELTKIKGINEKFAKDIKDQLKAEAKPKETAKPEKKVKAKTEAKPKKEKTTKEESKTKEKTKAEKKEKEEEVEIVEEEEKEYKAKKKPELNKEQKENLLLRRNINNRRPAFLRQEWFRYKRIPKNWHKPDGVQSKMRRNFNKRPTVVSIGFRGPKAVRGLHPSGFEDIIVHNVKDLEQLNPKTQAARIGGSVGTKKRIEIGKKAEELDLRILNM
jgi:large subunit ribosomal protein L32e